MFRNKSAYPVYLTIGNIPKEVRRKPSRRAHILLGYLPTTRLEHITNRAARRRILANVFHACISRIVQPLESAGVDGVEMASGDGVTRRTHPIFCIYVGDYPEQVLVTGIKTGECPCCPVDRDDLDDGNDYGYRDMDCALEALAQFDNLDPGIFTQACADAGIKPIHHPFWQGLPFVHIFRSITPDILHQLYQGVIKHLLSWLKAAYGSIEIDARCRRLPPNHNIRLFMKGLSSLSRVSGQEHNQICRILLGLVIDLRLPDNRSPSKVIRAVRALLDFLYLAQYPLHSSETLALMGDALDRFHSNKDIFVTLGVREHFANIPKLHFLKHFLDAIVLYGTTDNYNTEYTERLHIDLAKDAYRATNHKDEYSQMTLWLERKEKMHCHDKHIAWRLAGDPQPAEWHPFPGLRHPHLKMTKHPSRKSVSLRAVASEYGATYFKDAFARYWVHLTNPTITRREAERAAGNFYMPVQRLAVFHKIKFWNTDQGGFTGMSEVQDAIHVRPARQGKYNKTIPARFDTALVVDKVDQVALQNGISGMLLHYIPFIYV